MLLAASAAFAADAEGEITKIDADKGTITLTDGKTYKLPGEFDVASLKEGMDIVLSYDEVDGENLIADMQLPD
jgi:Cu/Ag efflux protein CusF